ncbi:NAD-dependent epimerase/dehydratase family protein [Amycolatopsis sp. NPDC051371]|uniref:NAD-dependent epimerase/dehydratase family protein n=1 Tax=Amycolatopsis sp. NPDC051371 TaxID=3155800 RepID=UPI0034250E45
MTAGEPDILVTGATGFVGTAVLRELVGRGLGPRVRILVRRPPPEWMTGAGVTTWAGDLTDAPGLAGVCTGITTLVHLASQVGGDFERCTAVNEVGTANLLSEAHRAGTPSVLYLSTCAVYRDGVHRGPRVPEDDGGASSGRGGLGAGSGLTANPGSFRGQRSSGAGSADQGSLTRGDGSAGECRGSGSGLAADPELLTGGGRSEEEHTGVESGLAADLGPSATRTGSAGECPRAGSEPVAELGPPTDRIGLSGERPQAGRGLAVDPQPPATRAGPAAEHLHPGPELVTDPASPTSRSRLAGERLVRAAGGTVLRPHLIHGPGDRHVVPALVRWVRAVPAWAAGGAARTSVVAVADLAAVIAVLALEPGLSRPGEVFHVADPRPVTIRGLATDVCGLLGLPLPTTDLPLAEHRARTRTALPSLTDHQYSLLTRDHWYESSRIWERTRVSPGPRLAEAADWYRESLGVPES